MPRWDGTNKRFVSGDAVTPVASAARTANGDSGWLDSQAFSNLELTLAITAVGDDADETLDVLVETASASDGTDARTVGSFGQATQPEGAQTERKSFAGLDRFYRVRWTVGGTTPSFTFSVSGDSK